MRRSIIWTMTISIMLSAMCVAAAKKPATKPSIKPAPKTAGTVPLAGDNGKFGVVYSMRKDVAVYFRLKSAEFTTEQIVIGDTLYVPKADQKLLVLHFTIQNPQKTEQFVRWDTLRFTAVDKMNTNHECDSHWGDELSRQKLEMTLKPAQKIDAFACFPVPAKAVVPKLMVLPGFEGNGPILRYDFTIKENKVAPLKAPIADPADVDGYTALETVPGVLNTAYPYQNFDITLLKFETVTTALEKDEADPVDGQKYLVATLLMKNEAPTEQFVRWDAVSPVLTSTDGEDLTYNNMLLATANRKFVKSVKPGSESTVRIYFTVPQDVTPDTLSIKEGESRTYVFKVQ